MKYNHWHSLFLLLFLTVPVNAASETSDPENTLKAAISYNLARFVTRDPQSGMTDTSPLVFCVHKDTPVAAELAFMSAAKGRKRTIILRELNNYQDFYDGCDISFISNNNPDTLSLKRMASAGSVTIGTKEGFLKDGGGIQLVKNGQKFAFSVNITALKLAHKTLSSRVLQLALKVEAAP